MSLPDISPKIIVTDAELLARDKARWWAGYDCGRALAQYAILGKEVMPPDRVTPPTVDTPPHSAPAALTQEERTALMDRLFDAREEGGWDSAPDAAFAFFVERAASDGAGSPADPSEEVLQELANEIRAAMYAPRAAKEIVALAAWRFCRERMGAPAPSPALVDLIARAKEISADLPPQGHIRLLIPKDWQPPERQYRALEAADALVREIAVGAIPTDLISRAKELHARPLANVPDEYRWITDNANLVRDLAAMGERP